MNEYMIEQMLKEKRRDMLQEAERLRLRKECERKGGGVQSRLALVIGDLLIRMGERLKRKAIVNECRKPLEMAP